MANYTYNEIVDKLISKIKSEFKVNDELSDKTSLLDLKLDSLDIMSYIFYIEEQFNIAIADEELETDNFLRIGETAKYILSETS
jgi:acyl carrier protein